MSEQHPTGDLITVLQTVGPKLTKVFKADGTTEAYDDAASFKVKEVAVANLRGLSELLTGLAGKPQRCIIRGKFVGGETAIPGTAEGTFARQNANFTDQALHFACIDVDGFKPEDADPVREPEAAVMEFIEKCLPMEFQGCSFHWQLSSSAGTKGKENILKAHVWFWLATPRTSAEMYAWARYIGPQVDKAVFRRVQVHYTASPIFEEGVGDPVPRRMGYCEGFTDEVYLQLDEAILAQARETGAGEGGEDMKLVDPSEKQGLVGAFHRAFTVEKVLSEFLEGEFEPVTERRWTWHHGGGTPEGVWVHSDGMHVHAVHNTWPCDGIVNLWDLVRIFKFAYLDEGADDFDLLDINTRPSQIAMLEWASQLPELVETVREERQARLNGWKGLILAAPDVPTLEITVAPDISRDSELTIVEREQLAIALQARIRELSGVKLPIAQARRLLAPGQNRTTNEEAPEWAKYWVWVTEQDGFMNIETKQVISERSYNAKYDRFMYQFAQPGESEPRASELALKTWDTKAVDRAMYLPNADLFFTLDGVRYINTYRNDLAPAMPEKLTTQHLAAITAIEAHAGILIPDARERRLFLDYLAYCVQNPGAKIRWAVLLKGIPGDGKTAFATMLAHVMGHPNVRTLNSSTLEGSDFSGWGVGQCVVTVEEVKLHGVSRHDVYNKLKPFISNDTVEIHPKGRDPYNVPNTSNYVLLTNYDDALPVDSNDRRIFFLRSPFVTKEQMFLAIKDLTGMDHADYFDRLFDEAIKKHPGALRKWLMERELSPEFRADSRAPVTAFRDLAVDLSMSDDEIAVEAELKNGGEGVYQDLVSVTHLVGLIRQRHEGMEVRTRRVSGLMAGHGFSPFKRVLWRGVECRIYYRGPKYQEGMTGDFVREELDRLEAIREARQIETEFAD